MPEKLTAIIPCKNEQKNIRACIESIRPVADEILVADSGSTDETLEIVRSMGGCRIIEREYINSGDFKNWAIPQASHPWILLVDSDERVTDLLATEIREHLQRGPDQDGYWIYRDNHFMGHPIRYGSWKNDDVLRFFHRDRGRYEGPSDHGEVAVRTGKVGRLRGRLTHYTCWSWDQYFGKFHRYTTVQAAQWQAAGRRPSILQLLLRAPLRFFRDYIVKLGFLDGIPGLQIAMAEAFYSFMKQARLWELNHARPQPDPESNHNGKSNRAAA